MFLLQIIFCVIFVYGILSLIQDLVNEFTYKKISHDMKIVVFVKNIENNIEQFIIELANLKKRNSYKQIIVVDLEENDDIGKIKTRLLNNEINVDFLSKKQGEEYTKEFFEDKNVNFV